MFHQLSVDDKQNEITAAKDLLFHLPIQGNIFSGDAMFCQRELCERIVTNSGDYLFTVKGNQKVLFEGLQKIFSPEG